MPYSRELRADYSNKIALGSKGERTFHVVTHNPNQAKSGETLYIRCPKLESDVVIAGKINLVFDLKLKGHNKNYVVQNLSACIISRLVIKFEGEILTDLTNYNLVQTYKDLYSDRTNKTLYGIQSENLRKLRSENIDALGGGIHLGEAALHKAYGRKYAIDLARLHPMTHGHGATYPSSLGSHIEWELTFAPIKQILISEDTDQWDYALTNIQLEYETIRDPKLADEIRGYYNKGKSYLYEHIQHFRTIKFKGSDTIINENINVPRRSLKGILVLFTKDQLQNELDSELFINPSITSVAITIEGLANKVYAQSLVPRKFWEEARRYFMASEFKEIDKLEEITEEKFLLNRYCLFVDLRSFKDNMYHGSGLKVMNTKDGVQLEINRESTDAQLKISANIFIVSDAILNIEGSKLKSIMY